MKENTKKPPLNFGIYANADTNSVGCSSTYYEFIKLLDYFSEEKSTIILITPNMSYDFVEKTIDVLLVPGGADVATNRYLKSNVDKIDPFVGKPNVIYEHYDEHILKYWLKNGKPTIGICRGMQSINVSLGGSLYQDIKFHTLPKNKERNKTDHIMFVEYENEKTNYYKINSIHHQAIKKLADGLIPIGFCKVYKKCKSLNQPSYLFSKPFPIYDSYIDENKNSLSDLKKEEIKNFLCFVECYKHATLPFVGFQYHPEEFGCDFAIKLINETLSDFI